MKKIAIFLLVASFVWAAQKHPALIESGIIHKIEDHFKKGEFEKAFALWQKNQRKYSASVLFFYWGGKVMLHQKQTSVSKREKKYKQAIRLLTKAEKIDALNVSLPPVKRRYIDTLFYKALAHNTIGNRRLALGIFQRIVKLDDRNAQAWYNIGVIYEKLDNVIEANRAYGRYLKILSNVEEEF